ncbi:hypothetical protein Patl1_28651 [Pistacia atlantica]|uniref:Uncharacterized protein n=1 Tax=Pistacia atlantica TaxID=434234 RepID=A0ACC1BEL1_9ROSI|nr:hypothetical protein Patl1_28651 [Pistacia atlantica]
MKIGGGVVKGRPRASALPPFLFSSLSACSFSSTFSGSYKFHKGCGCSGTSSTFVSFVKIAQDKRGIGTKTSESIISPGAKQGLIPLAIPLAKSNSGTVTALLRWPTALPGMELPVVEVRKHGVWLLAKNVDQLIHRILVEEDAKKSLEDSDKLFDAATEAGEKLYKKGDLAKSQISDTDVYLLRKVGLFPDVIERKVMQHFSKGDHVSALVTGEFYTKKDHFPGFARPFVFNAQVLLKVGRNLEAKDAARGALKLPWWTLVLGVKGLVSVQEVAQIAQWEDEQIEYIKEKVTEEGKQEDLNKGKPPAQIALDEAAFLLDLASVDGNWDDFVERIAECYREAGLFDISTFVS